MPDLLLASAGKGVSIERMGQRAKCEVWARLQAAAQIVQPCRASLSSRDLSIRGISEESCRQASRYSTGREGLYAFREFSHS